LTKNKILGATNRDLPLLTATDKATHSGQEGGSELGVELSC